MQIYINGRLASLKKGTSFEYVAENRLFANSDGFSMSITFPLRGCPENIAIFGYLNRKDVRCGNAVYDCSIVEADFRLSGELTIVEVNDVDLKAQFLSGRSAQNYDKTFSDIYINELDLGSPDNPRLADVTPEQASRYSIGSYVALPWVTASGNIENLSVYTPSEDEQLGGTFAWHSDTSGLSWQPYLLYITRKIIEAVGYFCDLSKWESSESHKYLLICNTLPYAWDMPGWSSALPHWSVEEYLSKLELLLGCEFDVDHRSKYIKFSWTQSSLAEKRVVRLDDVVEEYSSEIADEPQNCDYPATKNLKYKECDHTMWRYYCCPSLPKLFGKDCVEYNTLSGLLAANENLRLWNGGRMRGSNLNKLLYAKDVDAYFIVRAVRRTYNGPDPSDNRIHKWNYHCILQPVNLFGDRIVSELTEEGNELDFVPAWIDYTDECGRTLFLSCGDYNESSSGSATDRPASGTDEWYEWRNNQFAQTLSSQRIEYMGASDSKPEYYDRIYIGWWKGSGPSPQVFPYPRVCDVEVLEDWSGFCTFPFSLRLGTNPIASLAQIDTCEKASFKWFSKRIPDVRSVFLIHGRRYLCEKITATFTEDGMSQLLKGVFYPVVD